MRLATLLLSIACGLFAADGFAGKWELSATDPNGVEVKGRITLVEKDGAWSGSLEGPEGTAPLRSVLVKEDVLTFRVDYEDADVTVTLKLDGDHIKGSYSAGAGADGPVEGVRIAGQSSTGARQA
ncbi:MAG: hypothetical protein ACM336_20500 [Acidobacteriota bacterium]